MAYTARIKRLCAIGACALVAQAFYVPLPGHAQEQQSSVSVEEARGLTFTLIANGRYDEASALARTILKANPNDQAAWLALAQSEARAGRGDAAVKAAKQAWRNSDAPNEKYSASVVAAESLLADEKPLRAQLWLRRAAQHAPNATFKQRAERGFRHVRARTPTSVNLRFSVSPSNNINNGTSFEGVTMIRGLPFVPNGAARALSGYEYRLGGDVNYTVKLSEKQNLTFGAALDVRRYTMSSDAKAQAPETTASEFAFQELRASVKTDLQHGPLGGVTTLGLTLGKNWYGGDHLTDFAELSARHRFKLGQKGQMSVALSYEQAWRQDNDARSSDTWSLGTVYSRRVGKGNVLTLSAGLDDVDAVSNGVARQEARVGLSYRKSKPVFGKTQLELSLGLSVKDYDRALDIADRREDTSVNASATLILNDLSYFGFSPTATLRASRTQSNVNFYDTEQLGINFGLRSSF